MQSLADKIESLIRPVTTAVVSFVLIMSIVVSFFTSRSEMESEFTVSAHRFEDILDKARGKLSLVQQLSTLQSALKLGATESAENYLKHIIKADEYIEAFVVLDRRGKIFAKYVRSSNEMPFNPPPDYASLAWSKIPLSRVSHPKFGEVEYFVSRENKKIFVSKTVLDHDTIIGRNFIVLDLPTLFGYVLKTQDLENELLLSIEKPNSLLTLSTPLTAPEINLYGTLKWQALILRMSHGAMLIAAVALLAALLLYVFVIALTKKFINPFRTIANHLRGFAHEKYETLNIKDFPKSFHGLIEDLNTTSEQIKKAKALEKDVIVKNAQVEVAEKLVHDIRHPLFVLSAESRHFHLLPEKNRQHLLTAIKDIEDFTNELDEKYTPDINSSETSGTAIHPISALVESLLSAKRLEYKARRGIEFKTNIGSQTYPLFGNVKPSDFRRMLSNLVNNSVEAIEKAGVITIDLNSTEDTIFLTIEDSGKGIQKRILSKLMQKGKSFGKKTGKGLGLYAAKSTVESWGGQIGIESQIRKGTKVTVTIPKQVPPPWFVTEIQMEKGSIIVAVDDEPYIHKVWTDKCEPLKAGDIVLHHFFSPKEVERFFKNAVNPQHFTFLIDLEYPKAKTSGLDLIRSLGIAKQSILVTNKFDQKVIFECAEIGVRLIPKRLVPFVPVRFVSSNQVSKMPAVVKGSTMNIYDYFRKEDAPLVTNQIEEFKGVFKGLSVSHNVPLTLSTILKLLPFINHGTKLHVTTPDWLGYDKDAIQYLKDRQISFEMDKKLAAQGDILLDCSANFLGLGNPKAIVELTQTGVQKYRREKLSIPVVSIDDTYVKRLEDYFGTGDGFIRAYLEHVNPTVKNRHFIVWGYGKVGKGIARSLMQEGARVTVIDLLSQNLEFAARKGADGILASDFLGIQKLLLTADCLITATGVPSVVSDSVLSDEIINSNLVLANMGAEDEYGPKFDANRVLNKKMAFNFILREPTKMKFLDPIFYAHNLAAKLFVEGKLKPGLSALPVEEDLRIVNAWQSYWGIDVSDIFDLDTNPKRLVRANSKKK